jgi:hypothetical protein
MPHSEYSAIPLEEGIDATEKRRPISFLNKHEATIKILLLVAVTAISSYFVGFAVGQNWDLDDNKSDVWPSPAEDGLLDPQSLLPVIPKTIMKFQTETAYEGTGVDADRLWDELMPRKFIAPQACLCLELWLLLV